MHQTPAFPVTTSLPVPQTVYIGVLPSSPIGSIWVALSALGLISVELSLSQVDFSRLVGQRFHAVVVYDEFRAADALRQLSEYLAGSRRKFTLPLDLSGRTGFQLQVLQRTTGIPYGQTSTYKEIAFQVGNEKAARAVGRIEATNPIPLVIPCHRVLGSDGSLHGYGGPGGIKLKAWLLELEQSNIE
jgi:O-6-methylguanine DNA methyltransferase